MVDWFVLLTPLVLLPIILLLVFLGCTLDRKGKAVPVVFTYEGQLGTDVERFDAQCTAGFGVFNLMTRIEEGTPQLLAAGDDITAGTVPIDSEGDISCTCTVVKKAVGMDPAETVTVSSPAKSKIEDEDPPSFRLERGGEDGFRIV